MTTPPYPLRPVPAGELGPFFHVLSRAFGEDHNPADLEHELLTAEADRTLAAYDGGDIVATAGAFTFNAAVPGGRLPAAGVTYVGVRPTHRRRGLLTELMRTQLADVHERGEPLALLWASESAIYGRYGYGLASYLARVEIHRIEAKLRSDLPVDESVRLTEVSPADLIDDAVELEATLVDERPGQFVRDRGWLATALADLESHRNGRSALQAVRADREGRLVGYAAYRTRNSAIRPHMLPDGDVLVLAQSAADPGADIALTRLLLSLDLMRKVQWWNRPVDTSLPHVLADPRQARTTLLDGLWARLVDVGAALTARRYLNEIDVVLEVVDEQCRWNAGRWRLRVDSDGAATCARIDGVAAEVTLGVEALGAAYLGGTSLLSLHAAGRVVTTDAGKLVELATAFGWPRAPWCPVIF